MTIYTGSYYDLVKNAAYWSDRTRPPYVVPHQCRCGHTYADHRQLVVTGDDGQQEVVSGPCRCCPDRGDDCLRFESRRCCGTASCCGWGGGGPGGTLHNGPAWSHLSDVELRTRMAHVPNTFAGRDMYDVLDRERRRRERW